MRDTFFDNPKYYLDESQVAQDLSGSSKPQKPFYYSSEELDALGVPGFDAERDEADYWNRMQNALRLGLEVTEENVSVQPINPIITE